jgi:hypothetical protein
MSKVRFIGLDVHADAIAVAVAEPDGEVRPLGMIANRVESIRKLVGRLGPAKQLKARSGRLRVVWAADGAGCGL